MKTTLGEVQEKEEEFPKLKISKNNGTVVLFIGEYEGVVVVPSKAAYVGYYTNDWATEHFEDLPKGRTVTLEN